MVYSIGPSLGETVMDLAKSRNDSLVLFVEFEVS